MWRAYPRHSVNLSWGCFSDVLSVLMRGEVLQGTAVEEFEERFAEFIGVRHAVGVSSGRAALYLAIKSLGLAEGDEIIMPAYTFHIVPLVVKACGLKPVFVDVLPDTYNMDVSLIDKSITARTKAILATHMYGQPCDLEPVLQIAAEKDLKVIEDCAHALGAVYEGRKVGSFGDIGAFTFAMAKNMPCFGGGMLTTNDSQLYERLCEFKASHSAINAFFFWRRLADKARASSGDRGCSTRRGLVTTAKNSISTCGLTASNSSPRMIQLRPTVTGLSGKRQNVGVTDRLLQVALLQCFVTTVSPWNAGANWLR